jgi:type VI secretion system protein ImpL
MGTGALYSLPWYIIIGPPGSGKSTALQESGLNFPYMSQGRKGIRGVGGTRNCDWWFTDQGILLDTAGRYTTELEDRDEWLSFLDMLKKCRKRKPINGAIVCVSVVDLVQCSDEEREGHVKNIRDRIDELTKRLEQIFPVYLVFTKCDLLNGFVDFFEDYGKSDRSQVWGFTIPYTGPKVESYQSLFDEEVRKLYAHLSAQRIASLASERPMDKKRRIFGFPLQFAMSHRKLADFVGELFRPNPFQESSVLRGVYFTSGTQEGTPIDQLVAAMGGAFGLQEDAAGLLSQAVDRKSYFITTLFSRVIFGDQNLARSSTKVARRRRFLRGALALGSMLTLALCSISMVVSFFGNWRTVHNVGATAVKVKEAKTNKDDLPGYLRSLDALTTYIDLLDKYIRVEGRPFCMGWGLYRGEHLSTGRDRKSGIRKVFVDSISALFVKPTGDLLLKEMQQRGAKPGKVRKEYDKLYDLVLVYRMPCKKEPANKELMKLILTEDDRWLLALGPAGPTLPARRRRSRWTSSNFTPAAGRADLGEGPGAVQGHARLRPSTTRWRWNGSSRTSRAGRG